MGVQAMKHAALLREWTARFAECRSSGMTVKAWCEAQGLSIKTYYYWEKRVIAQANQEASVSAQTKAGALMRVNTYHGLKRPVARTFEATVTAK